VLNTKKLAGSLPTPGNLKKINGPKILGPKTIQYFHKPVKQLDTLVVVPLGRVQHGRAVHLGQLTSAGSNLGPML
jgi:hypothetical protein